MDSVGPEKHVLDRAEIPHAKGQLLGGKDMTGHARPHSAVSCAKMVNQSICHLGYGLGLAQESTSSIVFARRRQCSLMGRHIGATWRIRLNRPSAVAMWPYVKLL